jgi:hypothetical protein
MPADGSPTWRIFDEWDRFDLIVAALDSDTILSVHHLVTSPPEDEPYTALKEGLLHNHQLTDYQRIEKRRWIAATAPLSCQRRRFRAEAATTAPEGEAAQDQRRAVPCLLRPLPPPRRPLRRRPWLRNQRGCAITTGRTGRRPAAAGSFVFGWQGN